jgi:hypothetical protein
MWVSEEENKLLYYVHDHYKFEYNLSILSFSNTLIEGEIHKENITYMNLFDDSVEKTLTHLNEYGSVVIMENAKASKETLKLTIGKFFTLLQTEIPFIIMFSLADNKYRKPYTHLLDKLQDIYNHRLSQSDKQKDGTFKVEKFDLDNSIVIGNNAGRLGSKYLKQDISDCDRAFARNIGVDNFRTPEQVFRNDQTSRQWKWTKNLNIEMVLKQQKNLVEPSFEIIVDKADIIYITGPPTSGSTLLGNRINVYIQKLGLMSEIIDINNYSNTSLMLDFISRQMTDLADNPRVLIIIDNLETTTKRLKHFTTLVKNVDRVVNVKYIEMNVTRDICEFMNKFRLQISKSSKIELTKPSEYNSYYRYYKPLIDNGITMTLPKNIDLKYISYPLIIRERSELFFKFA